MEDRNKKQPWRTYQVQGRTLYLHHIHLAVRGASIPPELTQYFLKTFSYVLTDAPLRLRPLWPVMIRDGNELHIAKRASLVPSVDFALRAWDPSGVHVLSFEGMQKTSRPLRFNEVSADGPQWGYARARMYQGLLTILTGRVRALDALYVVTEGHLGAAAEAPAFSVTTKRRGGAPVAPGVSSALPEKGMIYLSAAYDATVRVYEDGLLVQSEHWTTDKPAHRVKVQSGTRVELVIGCDCVFAVTYERQGSEHHASTLRGFRETVWFARDHHWRGRDVPIDRPLIEAAKRWMDDPFFVTWWRKQLRRGSVPEELRRDVIRAAKQTMCISSGKEP